MKYRLSCSILKTAFFLSCLLGSDRCLADKIATFDEAYQHLISAESKWHDGPTPKDREALAFLTGNLEATRRMFVKSFLEGARADGPAGTLILLFPADERLGILREVVGHYEYGDLATPFTGALAGSGTRQDMEIIRGIFIRHPNADGVGELAEFMASSKNPYAHDALVAFSKETPGKWQERFKVRKFFATRLPQGRQTEVSMSAAPAQPPAGGAKPPIEQSASSAKEQTPLSTSPPATHERRLSLQWIAGGLLAILCFLFFLVRRKRRHRHATESDGRGETGS